MMVYIVQVMGYNQIGEILWEFHDYLCLPLGSHFLLNPTLPIQLGTNSNYSAKSHQDQCNSCRLLSNSCNFGRNGLDSIQVWVNFSLLKM